MAVEGIHLIDPNISDQQILSTSDHRSSGTVWPRFAEDCLARNTELLFDIIQHNLSVLQAGQKNTLLGKDGQLNDLSLIHI